MAKKKTNDKIIAFDKSSIKIGDKFFDVNQNLPSAELLGDIVKNKYIQKSIDIQINNYSGIVEQIDKKQADILKNFNSHTIEEFNELEKQKDEYIQKISRVYLDTLDSVFNILKWLLGDEAVEYIKNLKISVNDIYNILYEAMKRNAFIEDKVNATQ